MLWPVPSKGSHRARIEPDRFACGFGDRKGTGANRTSEMTERVAWTAVSLVLREFAWNPGPRELVHLMDIPVEWRRFRVHREARGGFPAEAGREYGGQHDE